VAIIRPEKVWTTGRKPMAQKKEKGSEKPNIPGGDSRH
jgi:hypothetical protein